MVSSKQVLVLLVAVIGANSSAVPAPLVAGAPIEVAPAAVPVQVTTNHLSYTHAVPQNIAPYARQVSITNRGFVAPAYAAYSLPIGPVNGALVAPGFYGSPYLAGAIPAPFAAGSVPAIPAPLTAGAIPAPIAAGPIFGATGLVGPVAPAPLAANIVGPAPILGPAPYASPLVGPSPLRPVPYAAGPYFGAAPVAPAPV